MAPRIKAERHFLLTLDPVHVGTGGNRLGRVDNSIVREPGTRLPKIPGTSLSGAVRQYAAYRYNKIKCAGQSDHCGKADCPICYTFGFVKGEGTGQSHSGVVSIGDARLLLFPVYTAQGPVWVTSPAALEEAGFQKHEVSPERAKWSENFYAGNNLNLGWLMVQNEDDQWQAPDKLKELLPARVQNRIVMVSDKLFPYVVNSNLEVRTSVSIDPMTGAAKKGALFTYEAIPRAAVLYFDIIEDDYRNTFKQVDRPFVPEQNDRSGSDGADAPVPWQEPWTRPLDVVKAGLDWAEYLGVGGMGTRGFGRIRHLVDKNMTLLEVA